MTNKPTVSPASLALFWASSLLLLALFLWLFSDVLTPFVLGITIAYLLDPLVLRLEKFHIGRTTAAVLLLVTFFLGVSLLLLLLIPPLYRELSQLVDQAPGYLQALADRLQPYLDSVEQELQGGEFNQRVREAVGSNMGNAINLGSGLLSGLLSGGRAIISFLSLLVVTPLVAFFMMREWQRIMKKVDSLIPRQNYDQIRDLVVRIDRKIAGFVRGQLLVALSLGLIYAVALSLAGLDFSVLIGLGAGLLSVIPLFGSTVGLLASVTVAWFQSSEITYVALIGLIFLIGQLLEGNIITPKLLGGSVGMHPLWILFSIMAGASLFGILGMLIAVPVAAALGVLVSFAIKQYQGSSYYR